MQHTTGTVSISLLAAALAACAPEPLLAPMGAAPSRAAHSPIVQMAMPEATLERTASYRAHEDPMRPFGLTQRPELGSRDSEDQASFWSIASGDSGVDLVNAVASDGGNVLTAGSFAGDMDLGCGPESSVGVYDAFLVKHDLEGECLWFVRAGSPGSTNSIEDIAVGPEGAIYVTGRTYGQVDFPKGTHQSVGGADVFIAKYGPDGTHEWVVGLGGPDEDYGFAVAAVDGAVYVGGAFSGLAPMGPETVESHGGTDAFVAKLYSDGAVAWSVGFGGEHSDAVNDLLATPTHVVAVGTFRGTFELGGVQRQAVGGYDAFMTWIGHDAVIRNVATFGGAGWDSATAIASDEQGDLRVAGYFGGTIDMGGASLKTTNTRASFVARYTATGAHVWSTKLEGQEQLVVLDIDVTADGAVAAAGYRDDGFRRVATSHVVDGFGVEMSQSETGGSGSSQWNGVAVFDSNNVVRGGCFAGAIGIGSDQHLASGLTDALIATSSF